MSDGEALLRAILEQPWEDTPRLAYADWLDEYGDPERAEFIRVQIRLAATGGAPDPMCTKCFGGGGWFDTQAMKPTPCQNCHKKPTQRSRELSNTHWQKWYGVPRTGGADFPEWHRGFVCRIAMPCETFLKQAAAIFALHPVQIVRLEGKCPDREHSWWVEGKAVVTRVELPKVLWNRLPYHRDRWEYVSLHAKAYPSHGAALEALSSVCIAHGRELAGLSPLTPAVAAQVA
jgi:uncharacterized protein (TIGR02996 family)